MPDKTILLGSTVIVTRPEQQAKQLCQRLQQIGAQVIPCPMLDIVPPSSLSSLEQGIEKLSHADMLIFTSVNAVNYAMPFFHRYQATIPADAVIAAIGISTSNALAQHGLMTDILPSGHYSSEGLLTELAAKELKNKTILILSGAGGRTLLTDSLKEQGAHVYKVVCYERRKVASTTIDLLLIVEQSRYTITICTSCEGLHSFFEKLGKQAAKHAKNIHLLVVSDRMSREAQQLGFDPCHIALAADATDAEIVKATVVWWQGVVKHD